MFGQPKLMVSVVPNAGTIRGQVLQVKPGNPGKVLQIAVAEAHDVNGYPNFVKSEIGKKIDVYVHPELSLGHLIASDSVEAQVAFRGDERGGRYVVTEDRLRKL